MKVSENKTFIKWTRQLRQVRYVSTCTSWKDAVVPKISSEFVILVQWKRLRKTSDFAEKVLQMLSASTRFIRRVAKSTGAFLAATLPAPTSFWWSQRIPAIRGINLEHGDGQIVLIWWFQLQKNHLRWIWKQNHHQLRNLKGHLAMLQNHRPPAQG